MVFSSSAISWAQASTSSSRRVGFKSSPKVIHWVSSSDPSLATSVSDRVNVSLLPTMALASWAAVFKRSSSEKTVGCNRSSSVRVTLGFKSAMASSAAAMTASGFRA